MLGFVTQIYPSTPQNNIVNILLLYLWASIKMFYSNKKQRLKTRKCFGEGPEEGKKQHFPGE